MHFQEEQERILKKRPPAQKGLNLRECREMEYLSKVGPRYAF